ncbi:dTMP kinase [Bifidobacterium gallicum]|uniref:Thymidylate kinase n=1 Tax=Bifidobacterium gallicum DSM 20093 = LMG 11596 TaxID=561180 RepID=D1NVV5_9BIFI|nr:dTMP kinase [Bifidobacterium gallicum]EFA22241.1 dTMP kinase [Bifidobacterium gallicum DSM 20093 = LMG 11596]KFI57060.1 thymidylate kinase [Bifidobacterium gallicum DSM 20093 = LMG 11596]
MFITFEGIDGAGKTTQVKLLAQALQEAGRSVEVTREPGGTALGASLRRLLLEGVADGSAIDEHAEALMFAADRAQHVAQVIRPAMQRGDDVICDRYIDSSVAYQGGGRDIGADQIRALSMWATGGLVPDLTIVLDLDPALSAARLNRPADRMESAGDEFARRTREAFLAMAAAEPERFRVIDASLPVERIAADVRAAVGL